MMQLIVAIIPLCPSLITHLQTELVTVKTKNQKRTVYRAMGHSLDVHYCKSPGTRLKLECNVLYLCEHSRREGAF